MTYLGYHLSHSISLTGAQRPEQTELSTSTYQCESVESVQEPYVYTMNIGF